MAIRRGGILDRERAENRFRAPKFYEAIVPPPFEERRTEVNVASGAAELAGGLAVLADRTRPAARWWLIATLLAVYWANVRIWRYGPDKFPRFKPALLYARLPVQGLFAWLTWRGTRLDRARTPSSRARRPRPSPLPGCPALGSRWRGCEREQLRHRRSAPAVRMSMSLELS